MNKIKFIIGLLLLVTTILFTSTAYADSDSFLEVEIKSERASINLDWNDISQNYKLYLLDDEGNEDYLWEGKNTNYNHSELKVNTPYKYKLYAYNKNGEEIDNVIISSRTLKEKNQVYSIQSLGTLQDEDKVYYPMSDNTINTVYNKDRLTLSWDGIPTESNEYEIYKNGDFLAKVKGFEYIDYDIKENEEYTYSIVGNKKLPDKEVERRKIEIEDKIGRSLSEEENDMCFTSLKKYL